MADQPELRTGFVLAGPGLPRGRKIGLIKLTDIAPLVARRLALPAFEAAVPLSPSLDFLN